MSRPHTRGRLHIRPIWPRPNGRTVSDLERTVAPSSADATAGMSATAATASTGNPRRKGGFQRFLIGTPFRSREHLMRCRSLSGPVGGQHEAKSEDRRDFLPVRVVRARDDREKEERVYGATSTTASSVREASPGDRSLRGTPSRSSTAEG
jgi:hypothetical protein